jgi:hypothetical protein
MDGFFMILSGIFSTERRLLLLLALVGALALALGFFTFGGDQPLRLVIYGGYWAMLVITGWFAVSLARVARRADFEWRGWRALPRGPALLVLICAVVLVSHERYGFKILMDEAMLLGTSMTMHLEKQALVPMRGNDIHGAFQVLNGQLDKRPLLHPFLTSVLHDLTGYRPENVFVLNTLLTLVLLALVFHLGWRIAGRAGGVLAVLLLTSLPLLAQNATGGGFEVLNLVMISSTLALGMRYARTRDADTQLAFVLSAVLLAHTRYESVLFLIPVALLILWVWWREQRAVVNLALAWTPLLLLPYALHHKVFTVRESSWELGSQPGYETPFSISYVPDNLGHALQFFFNTNGEQSNSLAIAVLGFVSAPFFVLWCVKILRAAKTAEPARLALALFAIGFAAHTALLMMYFWGRFDDPVIRRLSLPLNLALVLAIVAVAAEFGRGRVLRILSVLVVATMFAHSLPVMARHAYTQEYYVGREAEWKREFIVAYPARDYLVIDHNSVFWIAHKVSSTPQLQALERKEDVRFHFRNHTFSAMYVFQRFQVDPATGALTVDPEDDLGPDYQLEPVWERRFTVLRVSRISRVAAISEGPATAERVAAPAIESLTPAEREEIRRAYFERFVQRLP